MVSNFLYAPHPKRAVNAVHAADMRACVECADRTVLLRGRCAHSGDYITQHIEERIKQGTRSEAWRVKCRSGRLQSEEARQFSLLSRTRDARPTAQHLKCSIA